MKLIKIAFEDALENPNPEKERPEELTDVQKVELLKPFLDKFEKIFNQVLPVYEEYKKLYQQQGLNFTAGEFSEVMRGLKSAVYFFEEWGGYQGKEKFEKLLKYMKQAELDQE
jgi:hypothetical protein